MHTKPCKRIRVLVLLDHDSPYRHKTCLAYVHTKLFADSQRTHHTIFMEAILPVCAGIIGALLPGNLLPLFLSTQHIMIVKRMIILHDSQDLVIINNPWIIQRYQHRRFDRQMLKTVHVIRQRGLALSRSRW